MEWSEAGRVRDGTHAQHTHALAPALPHTYALALAHAAHALARALHVIRSFRTTIHAPGGRRRTLLHPPARETPVLDLLLLLLLLYSEARERGMVVDPCASGTNPADADPRFESS